MLALAILAAVAFGAALLTLFSGFGLGTLLLPAFALFLPIEIAVAATAVVHLANNLFKVVLVGRHAERSVVLTFGLPATLAAFVGAWLLAGMTALPPLADYTFGRLHAELTWGKLVIGPTLVFFALFDLVPRLEQLTVERRWLARDAFVGTGVVVAVLVDLARLLEKVTIDFVRKLVGVVVILMGAALTAGWI